MEFNWLYDDADRLIGETYDGPGTADDYITKYEFDLSGNRINKITDEAATAGDIGTFVSSGGATITADETVTGIFDANDRLLSEVKDRPGTAEDTNTVYGYGPSDQWTMQTAKDVKSGTTVGSGSPLEHHAFQYDAQGRMTKATVSVGGVSNEMTYKYGDDGIRIEQKLKNLGTGATETHEYLIDPNNFTSYAQVLEEFINNTLAKTFAIGHDVLSQYDHGSTDGAHTLLYDGHGSTRLLANAAKAVLQRYVYSAYGTLLSGPNLTTTGR